MGRVNMFRQGKIKYPASFFFLATSTLFNVLLVWYIVIGYIDTPAIQVPLDDKVMEDTWSILEATVSSAPVGLMRQRYIRTQRKIQTLSM